MKIVTKVFLGFLLVILIFGIACGIGFWSMRFVQKGITSLAYEFIPETNLAHKIETYLLAAMDDFDSYALSFNNKYYKIGMKNFEMLKDHVKNTKNFSDRFESLAKLKDGIKLLSPLLENYETNIKQTYEAVESITQNWKKMDEFAHQFLTNCWEYLEVQENSFKQDLEHPSKEILEGRILKISLINKIIDKGNIIRVNNFKAQAKRDATSMKNVIEMFNEIDSAISVIRKHTKREENLQQLDRIKASASGYRDVMKNTEEKLQTIETLMQRRSEISNEIVQVSKDISETGINRTIQLANDSVKLLSKLTIVMMICFGVSIITGFLVALFITNSIKKPIRKVVEFTNRLGKGDLSSELVVETTDEIGEMANNLNESVRNFKSIIKELADTTHNLSGSSEELASISSQMAASTEEMNSQANMVASSSEEVNTSVGMVASAAEELSATVSDIASMTEEMSSTFQTVAQSSIKTADNVRLMAQSAENISIQINTIASSVEEMTASLNEVAKNTAKASRVSQNANQKTHEINSRMKTLVSASKKIGKIVSVIKDIADQTNMLALNATIEAAGAGDAGKGFAVVAGEVKELAKQSADATDEIAGHIDEIQKSTNDAVQAIEEINTVINEIAGINELIAASVEEQTATAGEISKSVATVAMTVKQVAGNANESSKLVTDIAKSTDETSKTANQIARNIDELVKGVKEVARSSNEGARGVNEISKNISAIGQASKQVAIGASQTNESSKELARMATVLTQIIGRFKL